MNKVNLIQPRHNYAPPSSEEAIGHVYLPGGLYSIAARIMAIGGEVNVSDENFCEPGPPHEANPLIGIHLLGPPYVPEVRKIQEKIRQELGQQVRFLLGGQSAGAFSPAQISTLFGPNTTPGNEEQIAAALNIRPEIIPTAEETSLVPAYQKIPDAMMQQYLAHELPFHLSHGCKFACSFCAAARSFRDPITGKVTVQREIYRQPQILEDDLEYLATRAETFGLSGLSFFLSNLDLFQSPEELKNFAGLLMKIKKNHSKLKIKLKGLSTTDSFLRVVDKNPQIIQLLVDGGLYQIGFGIDGITPQVWAQTKKAHNSEEKSLRAIQVASEQFNIQPELLMAFGYEGLDTADSLDQIYRFIADMATKYGTSARAHVVKTLIPGADDWYKPENANKVELLIKHPECFQALDFNAFPSALTHGDPEFRRLITDYYLRICAIPGTITQPVTPITPNLKPEELEKIHRFNRKHYQS